MSPSKLVEERSSFQYSKYSREYEDRFFQRTGPSRSLSLECKACKSSGSEPTASTNPGYAMLQRSNVDVVTHR
jgi:hypothetical protein